MKEKIEEIIKKNELYWMMRDSFDSESVEQGVEELVDALFELFEEEND